MKKRNIFLTIICFFMIFALTGCGKKTAITTNEFMTKTNNSNYTNVDVLSQYAVYDYIKEATVAKNEKGFQIEFYVLDNEANAISMFNTNKEDFQTYKGNKSSQASSSAKNYSKYSLTSNGYYMYICRVDNTLFYAKVNDNYKDEIKKIAKELGY